jgi:hypothetical protein
MPENMERPKPNPLAPLSKRVDQLNNWIVDSIRPWVTATRSAVLAAEGVALFGIGATLMQISEWFFAVFTFVALGILLFAKSLTASHWAKSVALCTLSILLATVLIAITVLHKPDSEPWSNLQRLWFNDALAKEGAPGISLDMAIRLRSRFGDDRQYLADFGKPDSGRVSAYISPDHYLTFAFIDSQGESHVEQVYVGSSDCPLDRFFFLSLEVGFKEDKTIMRIVINGRRIRYLEIPKQLSLGGFSVHNGVFGADLNGNHGGRMDISEMAVSASTLPNPQIDQYYCYLKSMKVGMAYAKYSGNQFMRVGQFDTNATQPDPSHSPIYTVSTSEDFVKWMAR